MEGYDGIDYGATRDFSGGEEPSTFQQGSESTWKPAIPEPFWFRHWLFWMRPGCLACKRKCRNLADWQAHWIRFHER